MKRMMASFIGVFMLLSGCQNHKLAPEDNNNRMINYQSHLNPEILSVIKEFRQEGPDDKIYAVYFTDTNDGFTLLKQDTIIYISFLQEVPFINGADYKGILAIDSLPIAIFDKNIIGDKYYDTSKLIYIPLNVLKKTPSNGYNYFTAFGVKNDSLVRSVAP